MLNYLFHCNDVEVERNFKDGTSESEIDEKFVIWLEDQGFVESEEQDLLIEQGEAGFYEI